jgi:hypothetical protein
VALLNWLEPVADWKYADFASSLTVEVYQDDKCMEALGAKEKSPADWPCMSFMIFHNGAELPCKGMVENSFKSFVANFESKTISGDQATLDDDCTWAV